MADETLERLSQMELFTDLQDRHLKRVARLVEERLAPSGEELVREGMRSYELFVIFSGTAEATVRGKRRFSYGPGEFFGEVALVGHPQAATVTSLDEMILGVIDADAFRKLLEKENSIALHMVERLILRSEELFIRRASELL